MPGLAAVQTGLCDGASRTREAACARILAAPIAVLSGSPLPTTWIPADCTGPRTVSGVLAPHLERRKAFRVILYIAMWVPHARGLGSLGGLPHEWGQQPGWSTFRRKRRLHGSRGSSRGPVLRPWGRL